jgi:RNA polymerase primary sigma factor
MDRKKRTDFGADPLEAYLSEIKKVQKNLTLAEEQALAVRIKQGDKAALNELVQANLRFVVAVCRNYRNQGLAMGDLINEGNLGLIRAAQRFDGTLDFKFISYAVWWVRQAILAALADHSRLLKIAPSRISILHQIGKHSRKMEQELGRPPTLEELAIRMEKSVKELTECMQLGYSPVALHAPAGPEGEGNIGDHLSDPDAPLPDEGALQNLLKRNMQQVMAGLEDKEQEVLRLYFGLVAGEGISLEEIGDRMGVTRERIRQIKEQALKKLRHPTRSRYLRPFQE